MYLRFYLYLWQHKIGSQFYESTLGPSLSMVVDPFLLVFGIGWYLAGCSPMIHMGYIYICMYIDIYIY